ncbi:LysR family transcriptional regulator [Gaetbulibacter aestuarii]|uniref:LysR family transcriptional regulator n=1 Tax=Gaetbulibacter aestuarii TaxID=1502358 RepID=A0ABW7N0C0_9FLAO
MSYQIELRHLRYFLAVAEELHFRKAADRLYISQPGLSRQIKQMENDLGVILFDRHNRKVVLTKTGEYLKKELQLNLKQLEDILDHAKLIQAGRKGQLKIGYVGSAMQNIIPDLLIKYREDHPDVVFSLKEMENQNQIDELLSFGIDIGFMRLEDVPKHLEKQTVLSDIFCVVLPEDHPINSKNFKSMAQFKEETFILFDPNYSASYYEKVMQIFKDSGFMPAVSHLTIHATSIYKLVANHFGISIVPKSLQNDAVKGVKFIDLNNIKQRTELSMVWNTGNRNPVLLQALDVMRKMKRKKA